MAIDPYSAGDKNFAPNEQATLYVNGARSTYDALQLSFQRRFSKGLQLLASYTWSHSIDDSGNNLTSDYNPNSQYSSSDFDVRQNFQLGGTYLIPGKHRNGFLSNLLDHWAFDTRITARTAFPLNVTEWQYSYTDASGFFVTYNPNRVPGVPLYLTASNCYI